MNEGGLLGSLIGQPWSRLLPRASEEGVKAPPIGRAPLRLPCDVMRLPVRDMHDLGHWPETDTFCTVECELCGRLMVPHALRRHMEENHVDALATLKTKLTRPRTVKKSSSPPPPAEDRNETETTVYCSLCSAAVPSAAFRRHAIKTHGDINSAKPLKTKTAAKPSPPKKTTSKSASPVEVTDALAPKDPKKLVKKKKTKANVEPEVAKKSTKKKKDKVWAPSEYDPCNHCGVVNEEGNPCLRNIVCRLHPVAQRRLVNRPFPYDVLAKITKTPTEVKTETVVDTAPEPKVEPPPAKRVKTEPIVEEEFVVEEVIPPKAVVPRPKPLLCWSLAAPDSPPTPAQPPALLPDLPWYASQPRPLATNTFGCRIVGGLLTPSKKWDSLRKHIQNVWAQGSQDTAKPGIKTIAAKKAQAAAVRRKRKSSGGSNAGVDNLLNGLLQPANGVNGVPIRLFNGNQPTFIQLNLCPSK